MQFTPIQRIIFNENSRITPELVVNVTNDQLTKIENGILSNCMITPSLSAEQIRMMDISQPDVLVDIVGHVLVSILDHIADVHGVVASKQQDFMTYLVASLDDVCTRSCEILSYQLTHCKRSVLH